jgi:hypothetical protein
MSRSLTVDNVETVYIVNDIISFKLCSVSDDTKRDDLILNLTMKRYDTELQRISDLDSKANNMTGYVSIVISLLVGTGTFGVLGKLSISTYYVPYFIGLVLLAVSFLFALSAIAIRKYEFVPKPETLIDEYLTEKSRVVTRKVLATIVAAVTEIREKNEDKALKIRFSWGFLIAGLIGIIMFTFILALNGNIVCPPKVSG